jgi:hypothetical protein
MGLAASAWEEFLQLPDEFGQSRDGDQLPFCFPVWLSRGSHPFFPGWDGMHDSRLCGNHCFVTN